MSTKWIFSVMIASMLSNIMFGHNSNTCSLSEIVGCVLLFKCCPIYYENAAMTTCDDSSRSKSNKIRTIQSSTLLNQPIDEQSQRIKDYQYTVFEEWLSKLKQEYMNVFPIHSSIDNQVRVVNNALFSFVLPKHFKTKVRLVAVAEDVLSDCLDLDQQVAESPLFIDFISGNNRSGLFPPSLAHRYGGHQFGQWAGQLGDGRAVLLGEIVNRFGERWELQLKGSGTTPYSRNGDGRAVLRSSVREFLVSEAMHYLGVPTSRAVSLVVSDDDVIRDQFYNGHPTKERGAIVMRIAPSWFRIGSLEILAQAGEKGLLKSLLDFIIKTHFTSIDLSDTNKYLILFQQIVSSTAKMIAKWQSIGFTHGVCNTDNFSLLSITIDFGPYGFMEDYRPDFVPNTSDDEKRYSYKNQPDVGFYNLEKLKLALDAVFDKSASEAAQFILQSYIEEYKKYFVEYFTDKLGLSYVGQQDENVIAMFLKMLEECKADFTMSFRSISEISLNDLILGNIEDENWSLVCLRSHILFKEFIHLYGLKLKSEGISDKQRQAKMKVHNPRYVLRNWMAQNAIAQAEKNDFSEVKRLYRILKQPFTRQEEAEAYGYASKPPAWASSIKVSCSS